MEIMHSVSSSIRSWARTGRWIAGLAITSSLLSSTVALADLTDPFGGTPIAKDSDFFSRFGRFSSWRVRVSSFVYDSLSVLPNGLPADARPGVGESLFLYVLENVGNGPDATQPLSTDRPVTSFTVANPDDLGLGPAPILSIGHADSLTITNPSEFLVTGNVRPPQDLSINPLNVDYNWRLDRDGDPNADILHLNEFSIIYFRAFASYKMREGLVTGAALTDGQTILGPVAIPEPATIALAGLAVVTLIRRRRRTA